MELPNRQSIRLPGYDYSHNGYYFVTICVQDHACLLGKIVDGKMRLNEVGKMVDDWWTRIPNKYPMVELDTYMVMPNHLHGIIIINNHHVEAGLSRPKNNKKISIGREDLPAGGHGRAPTLGNVIGYFKYQTTKIYNGSNYRQHFWQRNYWERIIRNEREYFKIVNYIRTNPENWERDRLYS